MEQRKQAKLSNAVLEMKFMKKSKERVEKEEDDEEGREMYAGEVTEEMKKSGNINFIYTSIAVCKGLIEGRLSFGGMNPEVERMMENDYAKKLDEVEVKKEKDVSDADMANYNVIARKFQGSRNNPGNRQKKKFLKPNDTQFM